SGKLHLRQPGTGHAADGLGAQFRSIGLSRFPAARAHASPVPGRSLQRNEYANVGNTGFQFQQRQLRPGVVRAEHAKAVAARVEAAILTLKSETSWPESGHQSDPNGLGG